MKKCYFPIFFTLLSFISHTAWVQRVNTGLQALYTFREGGGSFVQDQTSADPLLMKIENLQGIQWIPGGGLRILQPTRIKSLSNANKIKEACAASGAITIETWVKAANATQDGPARIVTMSTGSVERNFLLSQRTGRFSAYLRTHSTPTSGTPVFETPSGRVQPSEIQHVVYTRQNNGAERLYINGVQVSSSNRTGNFTTWNENFELAFANEIDNQRPWLGDLYLVALYSKALNPNEVAQNHAAGHLQPGIEVSSESCSNASCFIDGFGISQRILWLTNIPGAPSTDYKFDGDGGNFQVFPDGTARLTGWVYNVNNPNMGWNIDVWFSNKMNWQQWSALGRGWKGAASIVGTLYQTWDYYIMDPNKVSQLTGTGAFAGSTLTLTHKPSDYYYGLQVGVGANDKNAMPGMSVWFNYSGTLNGTNISGTGDFNAEGECVHLPVLYCVADVTMECGSSTDPLNTGTPEVTCDGEYTLSYSDQVSSNECPIVITRTWTATSVTGQTVECIQHITLNDTAPPVLLPLPEVYNGCLSRSEWSDSAEDACHPNVTVNWTVLDSTVNAVDCSIVYTIQRTASDACGNQSTAVNTVTWSNIPTPDFSEWPDNLVVACGEIPEPITELPSVCEGSFFSVSVVEQEFSGACLPTIERTYSATDACGVVHQFVQYLFVQDNQAPVFSNIPPSVEANCGDLLPETIPVATDNCSSVITTYSELTERMGCVVYTYRTWTATDACGNSATAQQTIALTDNVGPQAQPFEALREVGCSESMEFEELVFYDACGEVIIVDVQLTTTANACLPEIMRTTTVQDQCGNISVFVQTIRTVDLTPPAFNQQPVDVELECGGDLPVFEPLATDACGAVSIAYSEEELSSPAYCRQVLRTWSATDVCGNTASVHQIVSFRDVVAPVLSGVPLNIQLACGDPFPATSVTATDNCDAQVNVERVESIVQNGCSIVHTITFSATDACGNSALASYTVEVVDNEAPIISGLTELSVPCDALETVSVSATDVCSPNVLLTFVDNVLSFGCTQRIERVYTATDACGWSTSFSQTITLVDTEAPVFSQVPPSVTLTCGGIPAVVHPVANDNCSAQVNVEFSESIDSSLCHIQVVRSWVAIDACGNTSSVQQSIVLSDQESPVLEGVPADVVLPCTLSSLPLPAVVNAIDNCSGALTVSMEESTLPGSCPSEYTVIRTWRVADACGNTAMASQRIEVVDMTAPVFVNPPTSVQAQCGAIPPPATAVATDDCSLVTVTMAETSILGGCPIIRRTYTATDACGNSAQWIQNIFIEDDEAPLMQGIAPGGPVSCNNIPPVPTPFVTDNCDPQVDVSINETIIGSGCEYTLIRTFLAEDDCGNSTVVSQTFTVADTSPPVFVQPQPNITLQCAQVPSYVGPGVTDDCGAQVQLSFTQTQVGAGCNYTLVRIYTATDLCGNSASFTQTIQVVDTTPPVIAGVPFNTFANCNAIPPVANPTATDACGNGVTLTFTETTQGTGCNRQLVRRWTATDACGNSTTRTQLVFVTDNTAPVISQVPANITLSCGSALPPVVNPVVTDNCSIGGVVPTLQFTEQQSPAPCGLLVQRTWRAVDVCGNAAVAHQTITISDQVAPVLIGVPADITVACGQLPAAAVVTATDNCSGVPTITFVEEVITGACPYTVKRTWRAQDVCGNLATAVQHILVVDNTPPVFSAYPNSVQTDCFSIPPAQELTAFDACSGNLPVQFSESRIELACGYTLNRWWTAVDFCGHTVSHNQLITVLDQQPPVISAGSAYLLLGCDDAIPTPEVTVSDCSETTWTFEENNLVLDCANEYSIERLWTATDACGQQTTFHQVIEVVDSLAPVISVLPAEVWVSCEELATLPTPTATDNCSNEVEVVLTETIAQLEQNSDGCEVWNAEALTGPIALWLPNNLGLVTDYVFGNQAGLFVENDVNGTAHLSGVVYNPADTNQKWILDIDLVQRRNWAQWSALGRSYKDDAGFAGNEYLNWEYYQLAPTSRIIGAGSFEGSTLSLIHAPVSFRYGFQLGQGANNRSAAYGLSGWFYYNGYINGALVYGIGDVMTEHICCSDQTITRQWTAFDCAGNSTTLMQQIHVGTAPQPLVMTAPAPQQESELTVTTTTNAFVVVFQLPQAGQTTVRLLDSNGKEVVPIYNGSVEGDAIYTYHVDRTAMPNGLYYVQLVQGETVLTQRVMGIQ
jgi:hypothetical protein